MWMNVESYARARYGLSDGQAPTKAQLNSIYNGLRTGTIPGAKHGGRWLVWMEVSNGHEK